MATESILRSSPEDYAKEGTEMEELFLCFRIGFRYAYRRDSDHQIFLLSFHTVDLS